MQSIRELLKIGTGPSSSHTMGPQRICRMIQEKYTNANRYDITLYGSLALTGKGHLTDWIIEQTLAPAPVTFHWHIRPLDFHPNGMKVDIYDGETLLGSETAYSVGGGSVIFEGEGMVEPENYYYHNSFDAIYRYIKDTNTSLYRYILDVEGEGFEDYLRDVLNAMENCVKDGLATTTTIPGQLKLARTARDLHTHARQYGDVRLLVSAYAYAVSEQNASGGTVVTAPTCGASGILPAILYYAKHDLKKDEATLLEALAIAGLFGNLVKTNATISGAEGGCQAEVGTATSMAAAAYASILGLSVEDIEYAAEMGLEHQLGLTCDPVGGYVQIPCIERNGFGALRAMDCASYACTVGHIHSHRVSFDSVVNVMRRTGRDLNEAYRETSLGGLAKEIKTNG